MKTRMDFVERWAKIVCELPDEEWGKQHATLINSQIQSAREIKLTKEQVAYIKGR